MANTFDRSITIQAQNKSTEKWEDLYTIHAKINKARNDDAYLSAGASQSKRNLVFEVRYFDGLEALDLNRQFYRILFQGVPYNIKDYDDYKLQHRTVKLLGVSY